MHSMSKKSLAGRVIILPLYIAVLMLGLVFYKTGKSFCWLANFTDKARRKIDLLVDKRFPLANGKKTNLR